MNRGIKVLQTSALPLGYGAVLVMYAKDRGKVRQKMQHIKDKDA